jgi:hypothetical protein
MSTHQIKQAVLSKIARRKSVAPAGKALYRVDGTLLHIRFCSQDRSSSARYKFNINPNTLRAEWECWICGDDSVYYLIPTNVLRRLYNDPGAYVDNHHPSIRVLSVDAAQNQTLYARGGKSISLAQYRSGVL